MAKFKKGSKMNIFLYIILFIIGSLFGSFYTLAVHRIPKRQDITHTHSYCPNCNNKLGFLDLIPILSYIGLRGKCRYCKEKIRPRYLILEVLSGLIFVIIAYVMKLSYETLTLQTIIQYGFFTLYITYIILICGIDKENKKIDKYVSVYGIVISIMYMIYLYIVGQANIYRYGIYLILYIVILILDTITLRWHAKNSYTLGILLMLVTMAIFTGEYITVNAIIVTLLSTLFYILIKKIKLGRRKNIKVEKEISRKFCIGFYLGMSNIFLLIIVLFLNNYII